MESSRRMESSRNKHPKEYLKLPYFKPYNIVAYDVAEIKTLDQVLKTIFLKSDIAREINLTTDEEIEVDNDLLIELAYGIQGIKQYDPQYTPEEIKNKLRSYINLYPERANVGLYFLSHFENVTRLHGFKSPIISFTSPRTNERVSPRKSVLPLPFCPSEKSETQIDVMTNDVRLMNLSNFMRLYRDFIEVGIPIPENNILTSCYNNLYQLVTEDIDSSKEDYKSLIEKIKVYLAVAQNLSKEKPVIDLQGAGTIVYALQSRENLFEKHVSLIGKLNEIKEVFSPFRNYKNLREKMKTETCIPPIWILAKDLVFTKENNLLNQILLLGNFYYFLSEKIMTLKSKDEKKSLYYTDLPYILDGYCFYYSSLPPSENDIRNLRTLTGKGLIHTGTSLYFFNKTENTCLDLNAKDCDLKKIKNNFSVPSNTSRLLAPLELNILHAIECCTPYIPYQNIVMENQSIQSRRNRASSLTGTTPLKNTHNPFTPSTAGISKSLNQSDAGRKTKLPVKRLSLNTLQQNKKIQENPESDRKEQSAINSLFFSSRLSKRGRRRSAPDKLDSPRESNENSPPNSQNRINLS